MLHPTMLFRFETAEPLPEVSLPPADDGAETSPRRFWRLFQVMAVLGNAVAGALFLAVLMLTPFWLERLLSLI